MEEDEGDANLGARGLTCAPSWRRRSGRPPRRRPHRPRRRRYRQGSALPNLRRRRLGRRGAGGTDGISKVNRNATNLNYTKCNKLTPFMS